MCMRYATGPRTKKTGWLRTRCQRRSQSPWPALVFSRKNRTRRRPCYARYMARATVELVTALRTTAARLRGDTVYQWGHMGQCNCGHLAQTITNIGHAEIHRSAMVREGDWEQQANDYCPTSGYRIDDIIDALLDLGMQLSDIGNLEKLRDREVLARLPAEQRYLTRNRRQDVALYMETWAALLEEQLPAADSAAA